MDNSESYESDSDIEALQVFIIIQNEYQKKNNTQINLYKED